MVIVARTQVDVAPQLVTLPPHDERHLRVGLVTHEPVDDMGTRLLQAVGKRYVGSLVEARHQFDDHRYFLASAGRVHEVIDYR